MKLIQFWDRPPIPSYVAAWTDGFRHGNPTLEYEFFDEVRAADFIAGHQGARALAAFKAIAVPAMKCDFFRLCAMEAWGGVYVDCDQQSGAPIISLIGDDNRPIVPTWGPILASHFLFFPQPHDPFIQACLRLATDNIEHRRFDSTFIACGPAIYCAVNNVINPSAVAAMMEFYETSPVLSAPEYAELLDHARRLIEPTPELVAAWGAIRPISAFAMGDWLGGTLGVDYKTTDQHWLNWTGSLYREDAVQPPGRLQTLISMIERVWTRR